MPFDGTDFPRVGYLEKLDKVADLIGTPEKWTKGWFRTPSGRYCLRGAIKEVDRAETIGPVVLEAIREVAGRHYFRIEAFNDNPKTDHKKLLAVLARARDNILAGRIPPPMAQWSRSPFSLLWWQKLRERFSG